MKKITLVFLFFYLSVFSQTKSTDVISFNTEMTAKFTLDKESSKVTVVVTGPADRWSSIGIGTASSVTSGDVYVYTTSVTDNTNPSANPAEEWNTISNTIDSGKRTLTLERALTNSDLNDLQMAFDSTNSISVVWSRSGSASAVAPNPNRGSTTANFTTTLGLDDISIDDEVVIYPNPTSGVLFIKTKKNVSKITIYSETGALVKTINEITNSNETSMNVSDLPKGLYIFELENDSEKAWKKILVN